MARVFMYTLSTCPWCRKTKKFFTERDIPFEFVDYDLQTPERQQEIEKEMKERGERMSFPWVLIDDTVVVGWDPDRFKSLLGLEEGPGEAEAGQGAEAGRKAEAGREAKARDKGWPKGKGREAGR